MSKLVDRECEVCGDTFRIEARLRRKFCDACKLKYGRKRESFANEKSHTSTYYIMKHTRMCHDCGKPSGGNYRCSACWSKLRRRGGYDDPALDL